MLYFVFLIANIDVHSSDLPLKPLKLWLCQSHSFHTHYVVE